MEDVSDYEVTSAMLAYGGSFIQQLALAFRAADVVNQARLREAFADKWAEYAELTITRVRSETHPARPPD